MPEIWDAVTGEINKNVSWQQTGGRVLINLAMQPNQSFFIVLDAANKNTEAGYTMPQTKQIASINNNWKLQFDTAFGGPIQPVQFNKLQSLTASNNDSIKYYSGTVVYSNQFNVSGLTPSAKYYLQLDSVYNMAEVIVNGKTCGTLWTYPFKADISSAMQAGKNNIIIKVVNTWHNRLIYDNTLPAEKRITWTNAPFRLQNQSLAPAGLVGNIVLIADMQ